MLYRQFTFEKRAERSPLYAALFNYVFVILYMQNIFLFSLMPCIVQEIEHNHHRSDVGNAYTIAVQLLFFLLAIDHYSLEKLKE